MADRRLVGRVEAFTGWDAVLYVVVAKLLGARRLFARRCARIYLKPGNPFHGMNPMEHVLVLELPYGAYRIVTPAGRVEPFYDIAGV